MKFSKLMLLCIGVVMTGSLMAAESFPFGIHKCREEKKETHTTYMGYESAPYTSSHPSIGYRYQNGTYILDVNGGYKYLKGHYYTFHTGKIGVNAYKSFHKTDYGQIYSGIGLDLRGIKTKSCDGRRKNEYSLHPSVSVGQDFNVYENKKVFFELIYQPYQFSKHRNGYIHSMGYRMGIGF